MSPSTNPAIVSDVRSRRLLLHGSSNSTPPGPAGDKGTLDGDAIMILAIILCALMSSLLLNTLVRCAIRCANRSQLETEEGTAVKHSARTRRKALRSLPLITYSTGLELPGAAGGECAICLLEFLDGDRIRVLPDCNHGFHVPCVDRWLLARSSCPTCRRCLLSSCRKVSCCGESRRPGREQSVIVPLDPERLLMGGYIP